MRRYTHSVFLARYVRVTPGVLTEFQIEVCVVTLRSWYFAVKGCAQGRTPTSHCSHVLIINSNSDTFLCAALTGKGLPARCLQQWPWILLLNIVAPYTQHAQHSAATTRILPNRMWGIHPPTDIVYEYNICNLLPMIVCLVRFNYQRHLKQDGSRLTYVRIKSLLQPPSWFSSPIINNGTFFNFRPYFFVNCWTHLI